MKRIYCDWCGTEVPDGPLAASFNVTIEIQPAYAPADEIIELELCPTDMAKLKAFLAHKRGTA